MGNLLLKLLGQQLMNKVKLWLAKNGFVGFLALAIAGGAAFLGMWFLFWASIGGFVGKNWEIITTIWNDEYKDKVGNVVDKVKDKFGK